MADTAAGIMLDTLYAWGIEVVFGLPGDGINGLMEGLRKRQDRIRFIQVRHEEAAALMACGYARYTGRLGACLATSGPGGIHLVSGLYNAKIEGLPVVALTGHHYHDVIGTHTQQDVDLTKLFGDVAIYSERVMGPAHAENVVHVACRNALGWRGVAHINIATDIQDQKTERRSQENVPHHQSVALRRQATRPTEQELRFAAELLDAGKRVVLLCGKAALAERDELLRLADALGAPVLAEELGCAPAPEESPYWVGCVGLLGAPSAGQALRQADTIVLCGAALPSGDAALAEGVRIVELCLEQHERSPHDVELQKVSLSGPIGATVPELLPLLHGNPDRNFVKEGRKRYEELQQGGDGKRGVLDGEAQRVPLSVLSCELSSRRSPDGLLISDPCAVDEAPGSPADDLEAEVEPSPSGLAYALAAQVAFPNRECVAVLRERNFSRLMAEFATAVRYRLPVRVVVVRDQATNGVAVDYAAFAKACGGTGYTVTGAECSEVLKRAFSESGPVLVAA